VAEQRATARATVLASAYTTRPERFTAGPPQPPARPVEMWINSPKTRATEEALRHYCNLLNSLSRSAVSVLLTGSPEEGEKMVHMCSL